jgi:hypothetical protein
MMPLCLIWLLGAGCESGKNYSNMETEAVAIQTQLDSSWAQMMDSDNRKLTNMQLLVNELKLINGIDSTKLPEFESGIESLKSKRYTQESMNISANIDQYDQATDQLWGNMKQFIRSNEEAEKYQVINQLVEEIGLADDSVIVYRHNYDEVLDRYNAFVTKHGKHLSKLKPPYNAWKQRNYFRLAE